MKKLLRDCCRVQVRLERLHLGFTVHSGRPQRTFMGALDLRLDLDLEWRLGLRLNVGLGLRFSVLLLLHEDLVVQELELSRVQFGFSKHWWRLFEDRCQTDVFIRVTGCFTLFILFIFWKFEVHTQTNSGATAGIFMVCHCPCF